MKKIGILGGGQLGRMFLQNAMSYPFEYWILDPSPEAPSRHLCHHFVQGDFKNYEDVLAFGRNVDVVGIEIEHVNIPALQQLQKEGKTVIPDPKILEIIQDKGKQKEFYKAHESPTADFILVENTENGQNELKFPCIQKFRTGGYDGKGVKFIKNNRDFVPNVASVIEVGVDIEKELAVIVVKDEKEIKCFPTVEMVFDPDLNLVDELFAPADISEENNIKSQEVAIQVVNSLGGIGIFAIELFFTKKGEILVNETAPRVHNSGHHTIEANFTSQFDAMLRVLAGLPMANISEARSVGTMINLVGTGSQEIQEEQVKTLLSEHTIFLHWYGKKENRKGRKMGHITVLGDRNVRESQLIEVRKLAKKIV